MSYRVLVTDEVDPDGVALLAAEPALRVDEVPTLADAELLERIGEYDAIVGRSATRITEALLRRAGRLRVVGRAGVGVDNVAMDAATAMGIAVINAPAGNTVAVAELFFGVVLSLLRHLPRAHTSLHAGRWERADLLGHELKGRTLGIVGLGRIGSEIAARAQAFGMPVAAFDPYLSDDRFQALRVRRAATLEALLVDTQVLTVHTPLTDETRGMIGRRELAELPVGAVVANLARGGIVDEEALAAALSSGHLRGAALDVYAREPLAAGHPLLQAPHLMLTPHIGASTAEAQRNVAVDVCAAVRDALLHGELGRSLNVADVRAGRWRELEPALRLTRRAGAVARALLADQGIRTLQRVTLRCGPELAGDGQLLLASAALGALEGTVEAERLNLISARAIAAARGMELSVAESAQLGHDAMLEVTLQGGMQELTVGGFAPPGAPPRLRRIGGFLVDVTPRHTLVILRNQDVPGVIGRVGTLLGDAGVNIAEYHQARLAQGGEALAAITVDTPLDERTCATLLSLPDVISATVVSFGDDG